MSLTIQEVETSLCGMLLKEQRYLAEAISAGLTAQHFTEPVHGRIFDACQTIWNLGQTVDMATVMRHIGYEHFEDVKRVRAQAPITQNFAPYLQAVLDWGKQSEIHARLRDISQTMLRRGPMEPLRPVLDGIGELLLFCAGSGASIRTLSAAEANQESMQAAEGRIERARSGKIAGIPSGIPNLDKYTYGFFPGFVYVLGARTAVGKTTLAANIAKSAATSGYKTAFVTVEMGASDIWDKLVADTSDINLGKLLSGNLTTAEALQAADAGLEMVQKLPIVLTEVNDARLDIITFELLRLVKAEGVKLIVLDYMQLFEVGDGRFRPAREDAKEVSKRIKAIARSLHVPILVLSQLNRLAPEEGPPDLIHIAESDQIARDADVVMMLYRESEQHFLRVVKNRRGNRCTIRLDAELHFSRFKDGAEVTGG